MRFRTAGNVSLKQQMRADRFLQMCDELCKIQAEGAVER